MGGGRRGDEMDSRDGSPSPCFSPLLSLLFFSLLTQSEKLLILGWQVLSQAPYQLNTGPPGVVSVGVGPSPAPQGCLPIALPPEPLWLVPKAPSPTELGSYGRYWPLSHLREPQFPHLYGEDSSWRLSDM